MSPTLVPLAALDADTVVAAATVVLAIAAVLALWPQYAEYRARRRASQPPPGAPPPASPDTRTAAPAARAAPVAAARPAETPTPTPTPTPKVFISWAHRDEDWDDARADAWRDEVLGFAYLLGEDVRVELDLFALEEGRDWTRFGEQEIREADQIVVALSRGWRERYDGTNTPTVGAGARREADALRGLFDRNQDDFFARVKLVVLPSMAGDDSVVPGSLSGLTRYVVDELSRDGIEDLVRALTGQPRYLRPGPPTPRGLPPDTRVLDQLHDELRDARAELDALRGGDDPGPLRERVANRESALRGLSDADRRVRRFRLLRRFGLAALCGVLLAGGWLIGHNAAGPRPYPGIMQFFQGAADITAPYGWQEDTSGAPIGSRSKLALAPPSPAGARFTIGFTHATGALLLKPALKSELGRFTRDRVSWNGIPALHYRGHNLEVWAAPTSHGVLTIACSSTERQPGFMATCERVVGTVDVDGAQSLEAARDFQRSARRIVAALPPADPFLVAAPVDELLARVADQTASRLAWVARRANGLPRSPLVEPARSIFLFDLRLRATAFKDIASAARRHDGADLRFVEETELR
jgi:hypothetical protein